MIPAINNEKNGDTNDLICVKTCFVDCFMGPKEEDEVSWMTPEQLIGTLTRDIGCTSYIICSSLEECLAMKPGKEELVRNTYMAAAKRREEMRLNKDSIIVTKS